MGAIRGENSSPGVYSKITDFVFNYKNKDKSKGKITVCDSYSGSVDLGLSVRWCTHNIGAISPEDTGLYFQWGDINGYDNPSHSKWNTCPFNNGNSEFDEEYFESVSGTVCPNGILSLNNDPVNRQLQGKWRLPSKIEIQELIDNTDTRWGEVNGVKGRIFTGFNGNSIFIPAAGYCNYGSIYTKGEYCYLWSRTLNIEKPDNAYGFTFYERDPNVENYYYYDNRCYGFSCRGVIEKKQ